MSENTKLEGNQLWPTERLDVSGSIRIGPARTYYVWDPKPDITAYELARALPAMTSRVGEDVHPLLTVECLPDDVRRHFRRVEHEEL